MPKKRARKGARTGCPRTRAAKSPQGGRRRRRRGERRRRRPRRKAPARSASSASSTPLAPPPPVSLAHLTPPPPLASGLVSCNPPVPSSTPPPISLQPPAYFCRVLLRSPPWRWRNAAAKIGHRLCCWLKKIEAFAFTGEEPRWI
ncbi:hypothetical protein PVAP13_3KG536100 [Panicum virgatum]|uniref:Uncharacterized protein n=1 Tax=Panicum virgatum TaxID=38727 RepID=A0A8T0V8L8_PANVG|nr:hypothetical protein PVAP13_3KG536100 [Panicum virgatum]